MHVEVSWEGEERFKAVTAGVVQWQDLSFPCSRRGFDSHRPLHFPE